MADVASLNKEVQEQSNLLKSLRTSNADANLIDEAKKRLGDLKKALGAATGTKDPKEGTKKKDRLLLKTPKGTRDYGPTEMFCREYVERIVKDCFTSHGGSCLDTPVFERKEILAGKYGEDAKLIFDLQDQGGEQLSLRYDHTVPLARYLAMTGLTNTSSKLWQVGKVYRRDNPVMSKGRMREFSQADFDIFGQWDPMIPESEVLSLLTSILTRLEVGEFTIKLNHRKILDGIFEVCGVPEEKTRPISSAVDKLDKLPWADVRLEMTVEKGLDPDVADKIGEYVKLKGGEELLTKLEEDSVLKNSARAQEGLKDMAILFRLLRIYKITEKISFDLSLARGLDYYTGLIYEAIVEGSAPPGFGTNPAVPPSQGTESAVVAPSKPAKKASSKSKAKSGDDEDEEIDESQVGVGSIAAGGRYDNLVGMFVAAASGDSKKVAGLPCIGVSIGLDRIFAILWPKWEGRGMRAKETMAYVISVGDGHLEQRIELVRELREAGIKADFYAKNKPKLPTQFEAGERDEVPFAILIGGEELTNGYVRVKEQRWQVVDGKKEKIQASGKGELVKRTELIEWLKQTETLRTWSSGKLV
ncbi:histidyl-tRNA synthetase [Sistotremastrum suecicum HHB10207 ss-3]|uniref:histidine--tRNA ligase n=1 Tax=Sistotremastrum suecicum HHB10207 ss-3 TaxID=1314776 RepID=A0A166HDE6_9AGAM|nr:histidyl-tRNA synthetase [Sistotremastrum suecicum HHB10207 ss-3]